MLQPETLQTDAANGIKKSEYPVVGAGFADDHDIPLPQITLRPGAATEPAHQESTPPVEPKRLPPTAAGL
jgi:hypothetical protein